MDTLNAETLERRREMAAPGRDSFLPALALSARAHAPLWLLVLAYGLATWLVTGGSWKDMPNPVDALRSAAMLLVAAAPAFVIWRLVHWARHGMPDSPLRQLVRDVIDILGDRVRLVNLMILFPAFYLFLRFFAVFKGNIAYLRPFSWDEAFMRADAWLHAGRQPWEWLAPLLSSGPATFAINFAYNFWFFVAMGSLLWAVGMRRLSQDAMRFLFAFLFIWIIGGSLMALAFSSAGPAYYERLGLAPNPYEPLMAQLREVAKDWPIWALNTQDMLWRYYLEHNVTLGGISAFPSMHNAQATLVALLAWRFGRLAGWVFTAYAVSIAIGSVWLGWHYAVDAYAGVAIAVASWWLARPLTRWMLRRPAMRRLSPSVAFPQHGRAARESGSQPASSVLHQLSV